MTAASGNDQGVEAFSTYKSVENLHQSTHRSHKSRRSTRQHRGKRCRKTKLIDGINDFPALTTVNAPQVARKKVLESLGPKLCHSTYQAAVVAPLPPIPMVFKHSPSTVRAASYVSLSQRHPNYVVMKLHKSRGSSSLSTSSYLTMPYKKDIVRCQPTPLPVLCTYRKGRTSSHPVMLFKKDIVRSRPTPLYVRSSYAKRASLYRVLRQVLTRQRSSSYLMTPSWLMSSISFPSSSQSKKSPLDPHSSIDHLNDLDQAVRSAKENKHMGGLVQQGNCIPVYLEDPSEFLTPVTTYLKLALHTDYNFLLESSTGGEKVGRYSFIGFNPYKLITINDSDPLIDIEKELSHINYVSSRDLPYLTGGVVGYVGFECVHSFEPRTKVDLEDVLHVPDSMFMAVNELVVMDHLRHVVTAVSHVRYEGNQIDQNNLETLYNAAVEKVLKNIIALRQENIPEPMQPPINLNYKGVSNVGQEGYEGFVRHLKSHIVKGDIFQAVPSQRVARPTDLHPFNIYRKLRIINPSPYMFYLQLKDFQLVGASPEALVKVIDGVVETHPIAGTRKRGKNEKEDQLLEKELLADEKERAEHIMLVDLGRNDCNCVCIPESVKVSKLMAVERYSHVMHIVSNVKGRLRPECTIYDAFRSIFPAGTVSGAPKIRAIQLIQEAEKIKRHVYAGAVGWFSYGGDTDTCIALRTMLVKEGIAYLQ
eukprot:Ihof_evm2s332 gene=Ihof_evmTU2s332